jgi:hypothetical protein
VAGVLEVTGWQVALGPALKMINPTKVETSASRKSTNITSVTQFPSSPDQSIIPPLKARVFQQLLWFSGAGMIIVVFRQPSAIATKALDAPCHHLPLLQLEACIAAHIRAPPCRHRIADLISITLVTLTQGCIQLSPGHTDDRIVATKLLK